MSALKRRDFLKLAGAATRRSSAAGCATFGAKARVVVVGGGFGGATAAKYIRLWDPAIEVVLVERANIFTSCPISNLVLGGYADMERHAPSATTGCASTACSVVARRGQSRWTRRRRWSLARGGDLAYDRLIVSPGIDFNFGDIQGYDAAMKAGRVLHAWKAGAQTVALRRQLERHARRRRVRAVGPARPVPLPARALRARQHGRGLLQAGQAALQGAGARRQSGRHLKGRPVQGGLEGPLPAASSNTAAMPRPSASTPTTMTVKLEVEDVKGDVLNVVPPHRAGDIAVEGRPDHHQQPLVRRRLAHHGIEGGARACTCSATRRCRRRDAEIGQHGEQPRQDRRRRDRSSCSTAAQPKPLQIINTCYSFVSQKEAIRVSSVHQWDAGQGTLMPVKGSGGVSAARSDAGRQSTPGTGPRRSGLTRWRRLGPGRAYALPGAAEAAGAARAGGELLHHLELDLHHRHHHQLRDALQRLDGERGLAAVPHRDEDLPLVVGVDQADQVAEHDAVLGAQARARQHDRREARVAEMDRDARGHQLAVARLQDRAARRGRRAGRGPRRPAWRIAAAFVADPRIEDPDFKPSHAQRFSPASMPATCATSLRASSSLGPRPSGCSPARRRTA